VSASDHLSPGQFMPVSDLLHMQSNDARGYQKYHPELGIKETTVESTYAQRAQHMADSPGLYHELDEHLRSGDIDPVLVLPDPKTGVDVVHEGHHRIVRAHQLHVAKLPVSHDEGSQPHAAEWKIHQADEEIRAAGF
jgi:hypothetical protein